MNLTFEQLLPSSQSTEIQKSSYRWSIVSIYAYNVWQWLENFWKTDFWGKAKNILFLFFFFLRGVYLDFHLLTITEFEVSFQKPQPKTIRYHDLQKVWRWLPWFENLRIFVLRVIFLDNYEHSHNEIQSSDDYEKIKIEEQIFEG